MAKKNDFVTAFIWACNILDTQKLSLAEQAVLFNLLKLINRNFWKPIKTSAFKLSRTMCSDTRTIQKALKNLVDKQIIFMEGDVIYIANINEKHFQSLISKSTDGETDKEIQHADEPTDEPTNQPDITSNNKTLADF